jgi:hypothetical protein
VSYESVHDVTKALQRLIHSQVKVASANAVVTLLPPGEELPDALGVNLYLYRVLENPATRNMPWRGDRGGGQPTQSPALGLQLYYLLTPLGSKPEDTSLDGDSAHTMLGLAMLALHENPVLNDAHLPDFDADVELPASVLNSYEKLKVYLVPTDLDELSKIWSTINKPYRLSAVYEVSLVELTPTMPPPAGGGIVLFTGVDVRTLDPPHLTELVPSSGPLVEIVNGAVAARRVEIHGTGFAFPGVTPIVRVGGRLATIQAAPAATDTMLVVALATDVDAGPDANVAVARAGRTGAPLTYTIRPWLSESRPVRTALDPGLPADLRLTIRGVGLANPAEVRFDGPGGPTASSAFEAGATDSAFAVAIPTTLAAGTHQVRVVLSDAGASASNPRELVVLPRIQGVAAAVVAGAVAPSVHELTITGERLAGSDVRMAIDDVAYLVGSNGNAGQLVKTLGRQLDAGPHDVSVVVDGVRSRAVELLI